jgi:hypothetical protein
LEQEQHGKDSTSKVRPTNLDTQRSERDKFLYFRQVLLTGELGVRPRLVQSASAYSLPFQEDPPYMTGVNIKEWLPEA